MAHITVMWPSGHERQMSGELSRDLDGWLVRVSSSVVIRIPADCLIMHIELPPAPPPPAPPTIAEMGAQPPQPNKQGPTPLLEKRRHRKK